METNKDHKHAIEQYYQRITYKAGEDELTFLQISEMKQLEHSRIFTKNTSTKGAKDDFDYMTNWSRLFEDLYQRIKWLKNFSNINHVAIFKTIDKFMPNYFGVEDNTLGKQLKRHVKELPFRHSKELDMLTRDLTVFYSKVFCGNDVLKAKQMFNSRSNPVPIQDVRITYFCCGCILVSLVALVYILFFINGN